MYSNGVVAEVIDGYTLVINKGNNGFLMEGVKCTIYTIGREIFDPTNGESLGRLENIKAKGTVTDVQDRISVVTAEKKRPIVNSPFAAALNNNEPEPFSNVQRGDLVRIYDV